MENLTTKCPNCGSNLEFSPKEQQIKCNSCGYAKEVFDEKNVSEHELSLGLLSNDEHSTQQIEASVLNCNNCGAKIEMAPNVTASFCPYCDTPVVLTKKQIEFVKPDGVRPFQIDTNKAKEIFISWINRRYLAPSALKNAFQQDKLMGIYLPYWSFDANTNAKYTATVGDNYTEHYRDSEGNLQTRIKTRWHCVSGVQDEFFNDVLIPASTNINQRLLNNVSHFDTANETLKSYSPEYMLGFSAQSFEIPLDVAERYSKDRMHTEMESSIRAKEMFLHDQVMNINFDMAFFDEKYKHVILPIYSCAYRYAGKTYNVIINGETGLIEGEYPLSPVKIVLLALLGIVLFLIFYYFYTNFC